MKIMIAYDGSTFADAAVDDLARAGFPSEAEVLVASVADFAADRPSVPEFDLISAASRRIDAVILREKNHREQVLIKATAMAADAARRIGSRFPDWKVSSEVLQGEPADVLLQRATAWDADVIMGGSQGRSAIGRFFLGSVSKSAAERSDRSVRIVRTSAEKSGDDPISIILGAETPNEAIRIVDHLAGRTWPPGTRVRLIGIGGSSAQRDGKSAYETIAEPLVSVGLNVSVRIESGQLKTVLLDTALALNPDAIFVVAGAANSQSGLDEIASALVTAAKCTVEIVR